MKKSYYIRIFNPKRFTIFISICLALLILISVFILGSLSVQGRGEKNYARVHIHSGDTLWNIAEQYNERNQDLRKFIHQIMKENDMETAMIYPGESIKIPLE